MEQGNGRHPNREACLADLLQTYEPMVQMLERQATPDVPAQVERQADRLSWRTMAGKKWVTQSAWCRGPG